MRITVWLDKGKVHNALAKFQHFQKTVHSLKWCEKQGGTRGSPIQATIPTTKGWQRSLQKQYASSHTGLSAVTFSETLSEVQMNHRKSWENDPTKLLWFIWAGIWLCPITDTQEPCALWVIHNSTASSVSVPGDTGLQGYSIVSLSRGYHKQHSSLALNCGLSY